MASVILSVAGSALGSSLGLSAVATSVLATAGAVAGSFVDNALLGVGDSGTQQSRQTLDTPVVTTSAYGQAIPLLFGTTRVAGNIIWMGQAVQETLTQTQRVRTGKFSSKSVPASISRTTKVSLAIGLGVAPFVAQQALPAQIVGDEDVRLRNREGMVGVKRIWADGTLIFDGRTHNDSPQATGNYTLAAFYPGTQTQTPDPVIEVEAGVGEVPGFRGLAYLVLQDVQISDWGNRIPNFTVEVIASLPKIPVVEAPQGMVEHQGVVYVACPVRRRIAVIDGDTYTRTGYIGESTGYLGTLRAHPGRLAVAGGFLYVTARADSMIQKINLQTGAVTDIPVAAYPEDITVDDQGTIWVTHPSEDQVSKITASGVVTACPVATAPFRIVASGGELWMTTVDAVVRMDGQTGAVLARIDTGPFPWGIAVNPVSGEVWVSSNGQDTLTIIDPATDSVKKVRNTGTYPTDISSAGADPYGSVAVTVLYGNQLKIYSKTYAELLEMGTVAFPATCLHRANGDVIVGQARYDFVLIARGR